MEPTEQNQTIKLPEVTSEKLPSLREEVARLREQPNSEDQALRLIRHAREGAFNLGEDEHVVNLYWEEYLVGKHIIMKARNKYGLSALPSKSKDMLRGYRLMKASANAGQRYIEERSIGGAIEARSHRFLGDLALVEGGFIQGRYADAVRHFEEGVRLFSEMPEWEERVNVLEMRDFLAEAQILAGDVAGGIATAQDNFSFFEEEDGRKLKESDYYTWAVWKSGCAIKLWQALLRARAPLGGGIREDLVMMLESADSILSVPEDQTTWGDRNFEFRKNEIAQIRTQAEL